MHESRRIVFGLLCHSHAQSTHSEARCQLDSVCALDLGHKTPPPLVPLLDMAPKKPKTREAPKKSLVCSQSCPLPLLQIHPLHNVLSLSRTRSTPPQKDAPKAWRKQRRCGKALWALRPGATCGHTGQQRGGKE